MVEWHNKDFTAEDILDIIRQGRDKDDSTILSSYADYIQYIYADNERILNG